MTNLGGIEVVEQHGMTKFPQEAASAWASFDGTMTGAGYKPIAYVGKQLVNGTNYVFLAEQTLMLANPERHIVVVKINEFNGEYGVKSIEQII